MLQRRRAREAGGESVRRGDRQDFRQRTASRAVHPPRPWTGAEPRRHDSWQAAALDRGADRLVRAVDQGPLVRGRNRRNQPRGGGQVPGNFAPFARALEKNYGLSRDQVAFFDVHEIADRDHSDVGDNILSHTPLSEIERAKVWAAVERSLEMWWQFFDGIQRACE